MGIPEATLQNLIAQWTMDDGNRRQWSTEHWWQTDKEPGLDGTGWEIPDGPFERISGPLLFHWRSLSNRDLSRRGGGWSTFLWFWKWLDHRFVGYGRWAQGGSDSPTLHANAKVIGPLCLLMDVHRYLGGGVCQLTRYTAARSVPDMSRDLQNFSALSKWESRCPGAECVGLPFDLHWRDMVGWVGRSIVLYTRLVQSECRGTRSGSCAMPKHRALWPTHDSDDILTPTTEAGLDRNKENMSPFIWRQWLCAWYTDSDGASCCCHHVGMCHGPAKTYWLLAVNDTKQEGEGQDGNYRDSWRGVSGELPVSYKFIALPRILVREMEGRKGNEWIRRDRHQVSWGLEDTHISHPPWSNIRTLALVQISEYYKSSAVVSETRSCVTPQWGHISPFSQVAVSILDTSFPFILDFCLRGKGSKKGTTEPRNADRSHRHRHWPTTATGGPSPTHKVSRPATRPWIIEPWFSLSCDLWFNPRIRTEKQKDQGCPLDTCKTRKPGSLAETWRANESERDSQAKEVRLRIRGVKVDILGVFPTATSRDFHLWASWR